jgi:23S rRNA (cytidine1920-2'-O)/16S rRNA (cytidine1409-2'-O)-methyltransferase
LPPGAFAVLLVKPQFEVGRAGIGKGGLLKDPAQGPRIAEELAAWLGALPGWARHRAGRIADCRWRRQP